MKKYLLQIIAIAALFFTLSGSLFAQGHQITDVDGNYYNIVTIGSQVWMAENLKTTKFNNSSFIPLVTDNTAWTSLTTSGYCWYNNDETTYKNTYGALYNWYTVNTGLLCPIGWHVPTDADWSTLTTYLGGESVSGGKLKEIGFTHWLTPNTGATNETGFTALPGGDRSALTGLSSMMGDYGKWWSSTYSAGSTYREAIYYNSGNIERAAGSEKVGWSVRCVFDGGTLYTTPSLNTIAVSTITPNSAQSGGNITLDGGTSVTARGICWSTTINPTVSDNHTTDGSGTGSFTSSITGLAPNTTYYVRAYATNSVGTAYGNEVAFTTPAVGPIIFNPDLTYGTITDIDNNAYKTIRIGTQMWMAENLKTTTFNDGTSIPLVINEPPIWTNMTTPGFCWFNNDPISYKNTYGALYNWFSVNTGKLCPTGWHVPAASEFTTLIDYLGASVAATKLKEIGTTHWISPNTGATNESGFTALPGGDRYTTFQNFGGYGFWWSSTFLTPHFAYILFIDYYYANGASVSNRSTEIGHSVRCINDPPTATINGTTAVCMGAAPPNITFTGTTGTAPFTFTYTINSGSNLTVTTSSGNSVTVPVVTSTAGTFTYSLVSVQDAYSTAAQTGNATITVTPTNTITLTSAVGTNAQTRCINTAITSITYATTGATGATVTGLPVGVTGAWAAGVITISGIPTAAGPFTYTVTLTGGCGVITTTGTITVTPDNTINRTSPPGTDAQTKCINTAITNITYATTGATGAIVTGLPAGVTGTWLSNVFTISGTPTASGPFIYTVTLTGGCGVVTATGTISVTSQPTATISYTGSPWCNKAGVQNVALIGTTGGTYSAAPAGLIIDPATGAITPSISTAGTYTVTYTIAASGGCGIVTATASITITASPVATFSYSGTPYCSSATNPSPTFSGGGIAGTFSSTAGLVFVNTATGQVNLSASTLGIYTVTNTIAAAGGCGVVTATASVTINASPVPTITGPASICSGTTGTVYTTESGMTGYTWTVTPSGSITAGDGTNSITVTWHTQFSESVSVNYTNANGCTAASPKTYNVSVNPLPTVTTNDPSPVCSPSTVDLTTAAVTSGSTAELTFTYWTDALATVSYPTPAAAGSGTYYIKGTSPATGCYDIKSVTVTVNPQPTITGTLSVCLGSTTQLTGSGTPAASMPWISATPGVATVNNSGLITSVSAGTSVITYTNNNGCSISATVTVNAQPTITGTLSVCLGSTTQLTGSGTPAASTPWVSATPGVATVNNSGLVTSVSAGTSVITYTNNNGCSITATVTINALPTITGALSVCLGSTTQLTGSGTPAAFTPWVSATPGVATVNNSGLITSVSAGMSVITYTNNNGCSITAKVTVNPLPTAPTIGTITNPTCSVATGSVILNGLPAGAWTVMTSPGGTTYMGTGTSYPITGLSVGSYTFTVNSSGCTSPASGSVVITPQPATPTVPTVGTITQPTCVLATGSVVLSGLPTGNWTINPGAITGTGSSTTINGLAANTYNYTVTNANGCISPATGNIVINAQPVTPTATALPNGPLIPGSSLSLIGGPGGMSTYSWTGPNGFVSTLQNPVVSTSATPDMAGIYTLTVTNSSGCQNSASTLVASNPLIVTNINDNGIGSLRYAMNYANTTVGTGIITFDIPGYGPFIIRPQTALPPITDPVIIDGYSQPGASATSPLLLIEIDGTYAGAGSNGLTIAIGNCTVKGLIINSFSGSGIKITGSGANSILGNYIGVDYSGTVAKGNKSDGIQINASSNNKIGGTNPGDGNVISANNGAGISILGNGAIGNLISSNSIYSNGGIGIDLGGNGVTSNDTGDPDPGPNNLQNFPVLGPATFSTGSVTISGSLNSKASTTYNLQFFASVLADNSGYGEGQTYLGSKSVTTSSTGDGSFTQAFAIKSSSGTVITATATDPNGNTSEFSKAIGGYQDQKVALSNWPLKYTLNADGVPNITDGSDLNAVRAAFNTWAAISTAKIQFTDGGTTTSKYANANDGVNLVSFEDDQFPFSYGVLAVAAKTLQVDPVTNVAQIIDADIVVNPAFVNDIKYNLGILDNAKNRGYFDIQSVITHEIGHVLGLLHSSVVGATMFFTMGSGTKVRTLEQDDISWASYGYPSATYNSTYGSISGNITYGYGGQPVAGAIVYAISTSRQDSIHAYSDAQGNYLVPGLIPGSYYIYIEPLDGNVNGYNLRPGNISPYIYANTVYTDYPGEFYSGAQESNNETTDIMTSVNVSAGSNTPGINLITNIDKIPPFVVSVSPTDVSASLVNITTNFSIKFSEAVDETSLSNATCYLTAGSKTIGGSYTILGNNVVLFDPESVLDYGTGYILHITKGVTDLRGNALQPEFTQSFMTISKDVVPPEVNEVIPANGATGVFVTDKIIVFFSKPMNKSSVEKGFVLSSGGSRMSGSFSWDDANMVVTFSPYASLKEAKTVYTITLPGSITDLAGNPLTSTSYSFTTVATAPPTITYLGPANNSTGVPVTTPIVVDFSEPINTYTVTSTTFQLLLGNTSTTIPGQFEFLNENSRVVFTPYANLNLNQSYTIKLTSGIQDVSLPSSSSLSPTSSTFTTAASVTVPDILYLDPSNGVAGDKVVITGTGFDPNPVKNVVTFNGLNATVTSATLTSLTTVVPQGALSGPVAVTVNKTASDNTMYFYVIPQSLNPCSNILGSQPTGSAGHGVGLTDAVSVSGVHTTYAYVTNPNQGTVSVVNLTNPNVTPISIAVGNTPMNIAINPQGTKAYVTNFNSHNVSVIDLVSNKVINTITVGIEPLDLTVTPDGKRVYVANYYSENVSMIDEDPNSGGFDHSTVNIATPSKTTSITGTTDNAMVLITDEFGLKIIDSNPADKDYNSITANVSTGSPANGVTATGDAALAIVSTVDGHLLMINLHPENGDYSEAITANVSTGSNGHGKPSGSGDNMFVYLPDTEHNQVLVYQIGIGTGGSGSANGSGISGLTLIPHNTIPIPTGAPVALAIKADASRLYVLDTKTGGSNSEITTVAICCGPITPAKTIGDLIIAIQDMINTGAITKLRGYALIISLNSALRNIYANRPNLAIVDLTAFNVLVNTYIKNKQITSAQGNALVNSATALINQLKGTKSALAEPSLVDTTQINQDLIPVSKLGVIYPNPFSQSITINYQVAENKEVPTKVQIVVYDINGRIVTTLVDEMMQQGCYTASWEGTYDDGGHAPYGTYFVLFRAGKVEEVGKILLIKPR